MKYVLEEQASMFGPDLWSGKTSSEPCQAQEKKTPEKTSRPSLRKSSGSSNRTPLTCLCLRGGVWDKYGVLYGEMGNWSVAYRVHDAQFFGVPQRRRRLALVADFNGLAAPEILFDPQLRGEAQGPEPDEALRDPGAERKSSVQPFRDGLQGDFDESGAEGQGASASPFDGSEPAEKLSFQERAGKPGGAREYSCNMNTSEPCQPSTTNPSSTDGPEEYGISSYDSNAMKSDNPHSGFYRADTARTLDLNGGNPACNQGGYWQ